MKLALGIATAVLMTGVNAYACTQSSSSFSGAQSTAKLQLNTGLVSGGSVSENGYTVSFRNSGDTLMTRISQGKSVLINWARTEVCGQSGVVEGTIHGTYDGVPRDIGFTIERSGKGLEISAAGQTLHAASLGGGSSNDVAVAKARGTEQ